MRVEVLIVGGGLAGLALAERLDKRGRDYLLVEGRSRLGGRILARPIDGAAFDRGPAWFWPGQDRMAALTARLGLGVFEQYAAGLALYEERGGTLHRGRGFASMAGSYRVAGGFGALIDRLAAQLPTARRLLSARVADLSLEVEPDDPIRVALHSDGAPLQLRADRVALALPPRLAAGTIAFSPALPQGAHRAMTQIPKWMAGHAKIIATYARPWWREAGLSGDAMSQLGPMAELHDPSPPDPPSASSASSTSSTSSASSASSTGPYALFGFVGVPAAARAGRDAEILSLARRQLVRLFGPDAEEPLSLSLMDWAQEPFTATPADATPLRGHPAYGTPAALTDLWGGRIRFCGTEVAPEFGGYLEGALAAAEDWRVESGTG